MKSCVDLKSLVIYRKEVPLACVQQPHILLDIGEDNRHAEDVPGLTVHLLDPRPCLRNYRATAKGINGANTFVQQQMEHRSTVNNNCLQACLYNEQYFCCINEITRVTTGFSKSQVLTAITHRPSCIKSLSTAFPCRTNASELEA